MDVIYDTPADEAWESEHEKMLKAIIDSKLLNHTVLKLSAELHENKNYHEVVTMLDDAARAQKREFTSEHLQTLAHTCKQGHQAIINAIASQQFTIKDLDSFLMELSY